VIHLAHEQLYHRNKSENLGQFLIIRYLIALHGTQMRFIGSIQVLIVYSHVSFFH